MTLRTLCLLSVSVAWVEAACPAQGVITETVNSLAGKSWVHVISKFPRNIPATCWPVNKDGFCSTAPTSFRCMCLNDMDSNLTSELLCPFLCPEATGQCEAPFVLNAADSSCAEGNAVSSGDNCTPVCAAGYVASESALSCAANVLTPGTFQCTPAGCSAPTVSNAASVPCLEGASIATNGKCTPQCLVGFTASVSRLVCSLGGLVPSTFVCNPIPPPPPPTFAWAIRQ